MSESQNAAEARHALTDRDLLLRFVAGETESFAVLVDRHAGLVMGVCRRLLRQAADAEDAFQATFLVLARKAGSQRWQESIAGWLHQTARRSALKLRSLSARRREVESQAAREQSIPAADAAPAESTAAFREMVQILDAELAGLPDKYREVIVLQQFAGLDRDEIAARLGISAAAVKDRLERGRAVA